MNRLARERSPYLLQHAQNPVDWYAWGDEAFAKARAEDKPIFLSGGWPMSVWLTPDLKPFYGGTYFPPESKWGRPGFVDILQEIGRVWKAERGKVVESAEALTARLRSMEQAAPSADVPGAAALEK